MLIRRYRLEDIPDMVRYLAEYVRETETYRDYEYDPEKVRTLLTSNVSNGLFFCNLAVANEGDLMGCLCARVLLPAFSSETVMTLDQLLYIRKQYRSFKVLSALVSSYNDWARMREPKHILLGHTTGLPAQSFGRLMEKLGYEEVGRVYALKETR